ncbi:WG repeat-containing protein [Ohtaekwangia kribbensis]|uniref:WG repeat-containing protein n=1 Tax=Ohtaekwangia kribbensis TaxID=688913 RepID=A0ABW3JZM6_9BACT
MTLPNLMRIATFFISILLILFSCTTREHDQKKRPLFPIKEYGKWGFIDDTGAKVVVCKFDYVYPFSEGMAAIQVDSLWGFIDETGEIVIPPKYITTDSKHFPFFYDGLCHVEFKTDTGVINLFIDKHDKVAFVSPYEYWQISSFHNGRARVEINEQICYIDKKGKVVLRTRFQAGGWFSEGIANLWMIDSDSSVYIDTTGRVLAKFSDFGNGDFHDGLAMISNDSTYYIDKTGKHVFTAERNDLVYHDFSDGMAVVYDRDHGYGFMDKTGRIVIPPKYDMTDEFYDGLCAVIVNDAWGFINKNDSMVIAPQFDYLRGGFTNGICEVEKNNLKGYINKKGKYIWREQYPVQYGKIDLKQWKLDTLEIHRALLDYKFETYFNYVRMGGFRYGNQPSLILDTTDLTAFADKYLAYKLYLINQTRDTVTIPIRGGRPKLIPQAINPKGEWQDLDIYDIFICGNEPHEYSMPPAGYQVFAAPFFKGSYKTKFRFKLYLEDDKELYSNTYTGYMNPEQVVTEETRLW